MSRWSNRCSRSSLRDPHIPWGKRSTIWPMPGARGAITGANRELLAIVLICCHSLEWRKTVSRGDSTSWARRRNQPGDGSGCGVRRWRLWACSRSSEPQRASSKGMILYFLFYFSFILWIWVMLGIFFRIMGRRIWSLSCRKRCRWTWVRNFHNFF